MFAVCMVVVSCSLLDWQWWEVANYFLQKRGATPANVDAEMRGNIIRWLENESDPILTWLEELTKTETEGE